MAGEPLTLLKEKAKVSRMETTETMTAALSAWRSLPEGATLSVWRWWHRLGSLRPYVDLVVVSDRRLLACVRVRR